MSVELFVKCFLRPVIVIFHVGLLLTSCQENSGRENQKRSDPSTLAAWIEKAPEEVDLDGAPLAALRRRLRDMPSENVHSVLIVKGEALVFEEYLTGRDQNWGDDLGTIRFARDTLHDLRSCTKSVVGSLIGIAIDDGAISSVDASIVDLFPKRAIPDVDRKRSIRLRHMLSMSAGLEWDETITYADPHNSEIRMIASGDPISYVLAQKPIAFAGQVFNYNSGLTELLASAVTEATGISTEEFARNRLFKPLGITQYEWRKHSNGLPSAASGLRLRPYDLAKFAYLFMHGGRWHGRQIVPEWWVHESLQSHVVAHRVFGSGRDVGFGYGYQWWIPKFEAQGQPVVAAMAWGNGGQCAFLFPKLDLIVVLTAGNYNQFDKDVLLLPHHLVADYVLPAAGVRGATVSVNFE
jgi:CubicO group peptidase (beta-lactamase class C family)